MILHNCIYIRVALLLHCVILRETLYRCLHHPLSPYLLTKTLLHPIVIQSKLPYPTLPYPNTLSPICFSSIQLKGSVRQIVTEAFRDLERNLKADLRNSVQDLQPTHTVSSEGEYEDGGVRGSEEDR